MGPIWSHIYIDIYIYIYIYIYVYLFNALRLGLGARSRNMICSLNRNQTSQIIKKLQPNHADQLNCSQTMHISQTAAKPFRSAKLQLKLADQLNCSQTTLQIS
jgi:hypothetical protein